MKGYLCATASPMVKTAVTGTKLNVHFFHSKKFSFHVMCVISNEKLKDTENLPSSIRMDSNPGSPAKRIKLKQRNTPHRPPLKQTEQQPSSGGKRGRTINDTEMDE